MRIITVTFCILALSAAQAEEVSARQELDAGLSILKANSLYRDKADWPSLEAQAHAMVADGKSAAAAYPALRFVVNQLGDHHSFAMPPSAMQAVRAGAWDAGTSAGAVLPQARTPNAGIGLVTVPAFFGSEKGAAAYSEALLNALKGFRAQGICRFVVDLRDNTGGNMWPMLQGLVPLLGQPPYGYFLNGETRDANNTGWRVSGDIPRDTPPVAVLLDRQTTSSGEFTAIAFEGRPRTVFFGEPTAGFVTANQSYDLPDGGRFFVAITWSVDRLNRPYRVAVVPDQHTDHGDATVAAATVWLKRQPCRPLH
jgi:hypothetical protein